MRCRAHPASLGLMFVAMGGCVGEAKVRTKPQPVVPCISRSECQPGEVCKDGACAVDPCKDVVCVPPEICVNGGCFLYNECAGVNCARPPGDVGCFDLPGLCSGGLCRYAAMADGTVCDDADACTADDACLTGLCLGSIVACTNPPVNHCVDDTTREVFVQLGDCASGACDYPSVQYACPVGCDTAKGSCFGDPCDGVTCTTPGSSAVCFLVPGVCSGGACTYGYNDGVACNDSDSCTVNDACQSGVCAGSPKVCDTPQANTCVNASIARIYDSFGSCSAGNCEYSYQDVACANNDCVAGACASNPCAGVQCHSPPSVACYQASGICVATPAVHCAYTEMTDGTQCDDANPCTAGDECAQGRCQGAPKQCTTPPADQCVGSESHTHQKTGTCVAGLCEYAEVTVPCSLGCDVPTGTCVGDPCKDVYCGAVPPAICLSANVERRYKAPGICVNGPCVFPFDDLFCSWGCTGGQCAPDPCQGVTCTTPPANSCQDNNTRIRQYNSPGSCVSGGCQYSFVDSLCPYACNPADDTPPPPHAECDGCTPNCTNKCTGGGDGCGGPCTNDCVSGRFCNVGTCDPCTGASHCGASCLDCTIGARNKACVAGNCGCNGVGDCAAGEACRSSRCVPQTETNCTDGADNDGDGLTDCGDPDCLNQSCDDNNPCTESDKCVAGGCIGTQKICNDSNACTDDTCNSSGGCVFSNDNSNSCNDGLFCTAGDSCVNGACIGTANPCAGPDGDGNCAESCNESNDTCTAADPVGSACTDGSACTSFDVCSNGTCVGGSTVSCDDSNPCTEDSCNPVTGCVNTPYGGCNLPNGSPCIANGMCSKGNCECADAACSSKVCSAVDCDCKYNANGDGTCNSGFLNDGVDDPDDTCGAQTCCGDNNCGGTSNLCNIADGALCNTNQDCESNQCECTNATCTTSAKRCSPVDCICKFNVTGDGSCDGDVTTTTDPEDCVSTDNCVAGSCKHPNNRPCTTDSDCISNFCECADAGCTYKECNNVDCDCRWNADGSGCNGYLNDGLDDPDDTCGAQTCCGGANCGGTGSFCNLPNGTVCANNQACETNQCECIDATCSQLVCSAVKCVCQFNTTGDDTCDGNLALNPDPEDCTAAMGGTCLSPPGQCMIDVNHPCNAASDCMSGICECANNTCSVKECGLIACLCRYNTDGNSTCDGWLRDGVDDAANTCGIQTCCGSATCNGSGGYCNKANNAVCTGDVQCETNNCECINAGCTQRQCGAANCVCTYNTNGDATCDGNLSGTSDPQDCAAPMQCCGGVCLGGSGAGCAGNPDCCSGYCDTYFFTCT
jgi:hypothetical protein